MPKKDDRQHKPKADKQYAPRDALALMMEFSEIYDLMCDGPVQPETLTEAGVYLRQLLTSPKYEALKQYLQK